MNRRRFLKAGALLGAAVLAGGAGVKRSLAANRYYEGPVSDHFDGRRFFNPGGTEPAGWGDLLRWKLGGGVSEWPTAWPGETGLARPDRQVSADRLRVTQIGHATLLVQIEGLNILTDPVYARRASPVGFAGPLRVNEPGVRFEDLPPIDLVLLTHNHYDHLDIETLSRLRDAHDPLVVTPLGNERIVLRRIPQMRVHVQDWGDRVRVGPAIVHCEPAHHWSARGVGDRRMALWSAFVIEAPAGKIYHVGDTGFHSGINYRAAGEKHGGFRLANLPIGAYEPRWFMRHQHQNPAEALEGMTLCGARHAAGHHWGTFQLTNEPIEEPRNALEAARAQAGLEAGRFRALRPGDAWDVPA